MALHLPIGPLKPALGLSRYRDANPVPTIPLAESLRQGLFYISGLGADVTPCWYSLLKASLDSYHHGKA